MTTFIWFEDSVPSIFGYALPVVSDREFSLHRARSDGRDDAGASVALGIGEEIAKDLADTRRVGPDEYLAIDAAARIDGTPENCSYVIEFLAEIDGDGFDIDFSDVDPGGGEQILD